MLPGAAAFSRGYVPFICAFIVVVLLFEFCNFYQFRNPSHLVPPSSIGLGRISHQFDEVRDFAGAANSTLGFQALLSVSPNKSLGGETVWRQEGMIRAANLSEITVHIPFQSNWTGVVNSTDWLTPNLKQKIVADSEGGKLHDGRLMSRLGHLSTLQHILSSNLSSAIIFENDADWAVEIRSQAPAVARAIRQLGHTNRTNDGTNPWGTNWDILNLGHCGASYGHPDDSRYVVVNDTSSIAPELYSALRSPGRDVPVHGRLVYPTSGAVCTYAYAVNRASAAKIFDVLVDQEGPWDLLMGEACNRKLLDCYAVAPELFHHQRWTGHAVLSGDELHGGLHLGERPEKFTHNIVHSARCNSELDVDLKKGMVQCLPKGWTRKFYPT